MDSAGQATVVNEIGWRINAVNWPLCALSGLFLFMRVLLKRISHRALWWDDYVLILAWVTLVIQAILWSVAIGLGYGDPGRLELQRALIISKIVGVESTLLILASGWSKTSFAITLLRLPIGHRTRILVLMIIPAGNLLIGSTSFTAWLECFGNSTTNFITGARCIPDELAIPYAIFVGSIAAAMDFTLALLPWRFVWSLQMKRSEKFGAALAMSMGVFAGIAALIKVTIFPRILKDGTSAIQISALGVLETALSIMGASIPVLRALVRQTEAIPMARSGTGGLSTHTKFDHENVFDVELPSTLPRVPKREKRRAMIFPNNFLDNKDIKYGAAYSVSSKPWG